MYTEIHFNQGTKQSSADVKMQKKHMRCFCI